MIDVERRSEIPATHNHEAGAGDDVAIRVTNTGTGMSAETLRHIFESFYTTKEVAKDTGLGLCQVFGIAKQSGGEIIAHSELGKGTTFSLYVPLAMTIASSNTAVPEENSDDSGHGACVLVVEDNKMVGEFVTQPLEYLGYGVTKMTAVLRRVGPKALANPAS